MKANEILKLHNNVTEAWNRHDTKSFLSYVDENVVWYDISSPEPVKGKKGAEDFFNKWLRAFPDIKFKTLNTVISEQDGRIAVEFEVSGTNTGPLALGDQPELPPTNRKAATRGSYFCKIKNGKAIEISSYPDLAGIMMQLGILEMHEAHA